MSSSEVSILKPFPLQDKKGKLLSNNHTFLEEFCIYICTFHSLNFFLHISSKFGITSWEELRAYGIPDCIYTHDTYRTLSRQKSQEILWLCMGTLLIAASFTIVKWSSISSFPLWMTPHNASTAIIVTCIWTQSPSLRDDHLCLKQLLFLIPVQWYVDWSKHAWKIRVADLQILKNREKIEKNRESPHWRHNVLEQTHRHRVQGKKVDFVVSSILVNGTRMLHLAIIPYILSFW